jgi:hypothetical protein
MLTGDEVASLNGPLCKSQLPGLGENSLLFPTKMDVHPFLSSGPQWQQKILAWTMPRHAAFVPIQLTANTGRIVTSYIEKKNSQGRLREKKGSSAA